MFSTQVQAVELAATAAYACNNLSLGRGVAVVTTRSGAAVAQLDSERPSRMLVGTCTETDLVAPLQVLQVGITQKPSKQKRKKGGKRKEQERTLSYSVSKG